MIFLICIIYAIPAAYHKILEIRAKESLAQLEILESRLQKIKEAYNAIKDNVIVFVKKQTSEDSTLIVNKRALICLVCNKILVPDEALDAAAIRKQTKSIVQKLVPQKEQWSALHVQKEALYNQYKASEEKSVTRALLKQKILDLDTNIHASYEAICSTVDALLEKYHPADIDGLDEGTLEQTDIDCFCLHAFDEKKSGNIICWSELPEDIINHLKKMIDLKRQWAILQRKFTEAELREAENILALNRYNDGMTNFQMFFSRHLPSWGFLKKISPFPY